MSDNPYQAPSVASQAVGVLSGRRDDLKKVAAYQKGVILCILVNMIAMASQFFLSPELAGIVGIGFILASLAGMVFVFLLAVQVYGVALGILLGLLALVPCIGLIVLLIINGKATAVLRQNGIRVGLFGANTTDLKAFLSSPLPGSPFEE